MFIRALARHHCRMGWRDAPRYTRHWQACQRAMSEPVPPAGELAPAVERFLADGVASLHTAETQRVAAAVLGRIGSREAAGESLWLEDPEQYGNNRYAGDCWRDFPELEALFRGPVGCFLQNVFRSRFRIWFGVLYRNAPKRAVRVGSQRWHSDSGPGSCINVMCYLHETARENGPLEVLPWPLALDIFRGERAALRRAGGPMETGGDRFGAVYDYYERAIAERYADRVVQPMGPAGLVVPFRNNAIHRGGFPAVGHSRTAIVFHCYPSEQPTPYDRYRRQGLAKRGSYPKDPWADF
jgi:hypothetical protein